MIIIIYILHGIQKCGFETMHLITWWCGDTFKVCYNWIISSVDIFTMIQYSSYRWIGVFYHFRSFYNTCVIKALPVINAENGLTSKSNMVNCFETIPSVLSFSDSYGHNGIASLGLKIVLRDVYVIPRRFTSPSWTNATQHLPVLCWDQCPLNLCWRIQIWNHPYRRTPIAI